MKMPLAKACPNPTTSQRLTPIPPKKVPAKDLAKANSNKAVAELKGTRAIAKLGKVDNRVPAAARVTSPKRMREKARAAKVSRAAKVKTTAKAKAIHRNLATKAKAKAKVNPVRISRVRANPVKGLPVRTNRCKDNPVTDKLATDKLAKLMLGRAKHHVNKTDRKKVPVGTLCRTNLVKKRTAKASHSSANRQAKMMRPASPVISLPPNTTARRLSEFRTI